jgi:hypothetical protein
MRCLTVLLRLSIPSDSGRDHQIVRQTANVVVMADRALESLHKASVYEKETSPKDLFGTFCNIARSFRTHAVSQLRHAGQERVIPTLGATYKKSATHQRRLSSGD